MKTKIRLNYNLLARAFAVWGAAALAGSLMWPMGFDQGSFAWVGDLILSGGVPYRDAWEVKGPATYYTYAACQWLLGRTLFGIRLLDLVFLLPAAVALRGLLAHWSRRVWGDFAALLFVFLYLRMGYWNTATSDGYAMLLTLGAAALVARQGRVSLGRLAAAGLLAGLAVMYKATFLVLFLPLLGFLLRDARTNPRGALAGAGVFLGAAGVMAGAWAVLLARRQGLASFIEINTFMKEVYRDAHHRTFTDHLLALNHGLKDFWLVALPGLFALLHDFRRRRALKLFCLAWLALGLVTVVLQNKYYTYHFLIILPPLALLAGLGLAQFRHVPHGRAGALTVKVLAALVLLTALPEPNILAIQSLATEHGLGSAYYLNFLAHDNVTFEQSRRVAAHIRLRTAPGDSVQVWGWDNLIYYLSGRPCATRFGFIYPLVQASDSGRHEHLEKYLAEFMHAMRTNRPRFVVVADRDKNNLTRLTSRQYLALPPFRGLADYVATHYEKDMVFKNYTVWRLKPGAGR